MGLTANYPQVQLTCCCTSQWLPCLSCFTFPCLPPECSTSQTNVCPWIPVSGCAYAGETRHLATSQLLQPCLRSVLHAFSRSHRLSAGTPTAGSPAPGLCCAACPELHTVSSVGPSRLCSSPAPPWGLPDDFHLGPSHLLTSIFATFSHIKQCTLKKSVPEDMFIDFRILERGRGVERERDTHIDVRQKHHSVASHAPWPGIKPATYVCALTGDQTCNILVQGTMLQPNEPPGQG